MLPKNALTMVALALLVAVTPLSAADRCADAKLINDLQRAVDASAFFTVFDDVTIDVDDEGTVILTGHVIANHTRDDILGRVLRVDGVARVRNDLALLPVSQLDTELRYLTGRSIYGSATFWHYAARRNPPIHIVVQHGHVTLTGLVDSEADRVMAGVLASTVGMRSLTNALKLSVRARSARSNRRISGAPAVVSCSSDSCHESRSAGISAGGVAHTGPGAR